jgi:nucleotide-binding universal stress UspA family protein
MKNISILYGLSGSQQSAQAAELAWRIAEETEGSIFAQHVIDTRTFWELLRNEAPGFIGSGPYIAIYEEIEKSLKSLANKLTVKFEALSEGRKIPVTTSIEEGGPVDRICRKAKDCDLVIVGHQPRNSELHDAEHWRCVRYAVAEGLAHFCPRPLLVVQNRVDSWKSLTILLSSDHINRPFIKACLDMASLLKLDAKLVLLASGAREGSPASLEEDLRQSEPRLKNLPIEIVEFEGIAVDSSAGLWRSEFLELDWSPDPETLMVIPTRASGRRRLTVFDTSPDLFIRHLSLPSIMLWPEEHIKILEKESKESQEAGAV